MQRIPRANYVDIVFPIYLWITIREKQSYGNCMQWNNPVFSSLNSSHVPQGMINKNIYKENKLEHKASKWSFISHISHFFQPEYITLARSWFSRFMTTFRWSWIVPKLKVESIIWNSGYDEWKNDAILVINYRRREIVLRNIHFHLVINWVM